MHISIINGPNLNLLGTREPEIYGTESFDSFLEQLKHRFPAVSLDYFQSNGEGEIVTAVQRVAQSKTEGLVINAAAYAHTSIAIADALATVPQPVIEVHLSNVFQREAFRHHSYLAPKVKGQIIGLGLEGYALAIEYLLHAADKTGRMR